MKKTYRVQKLQADGTMEISLLYGAENPLQALKKHVYYINLSKNVAKETDIYETKHGYAIDVFDTVYWVKKEI